jgi:DNA mismatch repair protein MutS2
VDIHARTRRALEWDSLKEFLAAEACTAWAYEQCLALEPSVESAVVEQLLDETSEAVSLLAARSQLALEEIPDLRESIKRLTAGASLTAFELLEVKTVLERARAARASLSLLDRQSFPRLTDFVPRLFAVEHLSKAIDEAIDPAGQVKDEASSQLSSLRKEVKKIDGRIKDELARIIHSTALSKALQEPLYTQRGNRYVLPVDASQRHVIDGIVHDSSASGLTVYVEPKAVVELSNRMRMRESEIEREIARILLELTAQANKCRDEIESSYIALVDLDFIMARARLSLKYNGQKPELSKECELRLLSARHPLLILQDPARASRVVPNDILLGTNNRTMVVTGPNTGGKTVLLKTAGLLSLLLRGGLLLPVAPGSVATVFTDIFADIGDEQSLAQNLSTFSSHMTNIVEVINQARPQTLVLLDEIGAGTDPKEGAALARAVLEHLNESGALTITTTHYGELKTLAYTQEGFINASLDFDETTLSPTYRLRLGVPGSSKATTIASRLGLNASVVDRAVSFLKSNSRDLEKLTEELEMRLKNLAVDQETAAAARLEAEGLRDRAKSELTDIDSESERLRATLAQELEQEFKHVREQLRSLIATLQKEPSMKAAQQAQIQMAKIKEELKWTSPKKSAPVAKITIGQQVRVKSLNQIAIVEAIPEDENILPGTAISVRAGNMKIKVPLSDIETTGVSQPRGAKRAPAKSAADRQRRTMIQSSEVEVNSPGVFVRTSSNTLDLRGKRAEAALAELERFLDQSYLGATSPLMIIHGHGTGVIKSVVRDYLASSSYPKSFRSGEIYEGGDGVTVVEL